MQKPFHSHRVFTWSDHPRKRYPISQLGHCLRIPFGKLHRRDHSAWLMSYSKGTKGTRRSIYSYILWIFFSNAVTEDVPRPNDPWAAASLCFPFFSFYFYFFIEVFGVVERNHGGFCDLVFVESLGSQTFLGLRHA